MNARCTLLLLLLLLTLSARAQTDAPATNVTLQQLRQQAVTLDQQPVRVKFHYRSAITQLDAERYYVRLYDKDYHSIWVEFPKEGLVAMKNLPTFDKYSATRGLYIFGKVRTPSVNNTPSYYYSGTTIVPVILDAFGTNVSKGLAGKGTKYVW